MRVDRQEVDKARRRDRRLAEEHTITINDARRRHLYRSNHAAASVTQRTALLVADVTHQHHDPIYQRPDAETTAGEQLGQGDAIVAQVPPASANSAEKDLKQPGDDFLLIRVRFPGHWMAAVGRRGVCHRSKAGLSWEGLSKAGLSWEGLSRVGLSRVRLA